MEGSGKGIKGGDKLDTCLGTLYKDARATGTFWLVDVRGESAQVRKLTTEEIEAMGVQAESDIAEAERALASARNRLAQAEQLKDAARRLEIPF